MRLRHVMRMHANGMQVAAAGNKPQEIFVPFPAAIRSATATLCNEGTAISVAELQLRAEHYNLTLAANVLDAMALVPGTTALLPIRCGHTPGGHMPGSPAARFGAQRDSAGSFCLSKLPHVFRYLWRVQL